MSRDGGDKKIGGREIGEGPYEGEGGQATLAEKRVSVTVEFKIAFREITRETALEMGLSRDLAEVQRDGALVETVEMQGRLLNALLKDEEALRQFIACAVVEEIVDSRGELLREGLNVKSEEEALRPVIEALGGDVAEYYSGVREGMFDENIELLIYSTPVKCLAVRMRVVEISKEGGESDNFLTYLSFVQNSDDLRS
jgi:hypothetical protein